MPSESKNVDFKPIRLETLEHKVQQWIRNEKT